MGPFPPLGSQPCGFIEARQRAAASSQLAGGRGRLRRREPRPPLPPSPHPPPPRVHTCEGHTKAHDSRRTVAQTKARPSQLPSSSSQLPESEVAELPWRLPSTISYLLGPVKTLYTPSWRVPQTTRTHADDWINSSTHIHTLKYFFSDPQHFIHTHTPHILLPPRTDPQAQTHLHTWTAQV